MNNWKRLYEIENWRYKLSEDKIRFKDSGAWKIKDAVYDCFDKPVWQEVESNIMSYKNWLDSNDKKHPFKEIPNGYTSDLCLLTSKELAIRYLEYLANKLNNDWEPEWSNVTQKKYYVYYNNNIEKFVTCGDARMSYGLTVFRSVETAEQAIEIARPQLKLIMGVK